jgi:hypothetical protein
LDLRGRKWWQAGEDCILRSFITCMYFLVIKSMRMRMAVHVARMGEIRNAYKVLIGKSKMKNHLEDLAVDGRIILDRILWK